ncbi:MAG TPA: hypothetical protein VF433_15705, partial [Cellvibrio sp.]
AVLTAASDHLRKVTYSPFEGFILQPAFFSAQLRVLCVSVVVSSKRLLTTELSMRGGAPPNMKKLIFEVSYLPPAWTGDRK